MIISNNNFNSNNNNFKSTVNSIKNGSIDTTHNHIDTIKPKAYKDINNKDEMIEQSIAILQQRLSKGLISIDEFQKQCEKLGKLRK